MHLGCQRWEKKGKYLGLPSDWGGTKNDMFSWINARVDMKLEGWKGNLFSKAEKETLIKAVGQAIPQYAMSIFKVPISICKSIERRISQFWWKNSEAKTGLHWRRWELLKVRKDAGGLGFKDMANFNRALLGKLAWRLAQNQNSLWCRLLKGIYFPNRSFLQAEKGSRPS